MDWIWPLFKKYVVKQFARTGNEHPTDDDLHDAFLALLSQSTVTVLVQEPWQNSVRFKGLERGPVPEKMDLLRDPMAYLADHYGGGKFKLNFHDGWNFVATQNFKPDGEPKWQDLPGIDF